MSTTKTRAPEVIKGNHLTVTRHKIGTVILEWDWDALLAEVQTATATVGKKNIVKETETKVTKTRAKKAEEKASPAKTKPTAKKAPAKKPAAKKTTSKTKKA